MGCLCDTCFEIDRRKYRSGLFCKKCDGYIVEIDDLFLPSISLLNKKGYYTKNCCSAHICDKYICDAYIQFEDFIIFPDLPNEFKYDKDWHPEMYNKNGGMGVIRRYIDIDKNEYEKHKDILTTSLDLLDWVIGLPILEKDNKNERQ